MRKVVVVVLILLLVASAVFVLAGRSAGPVIAIVTPGKYAGASTPVDVTIEAPGGRVDDVSVVFEQNGVRTTIQASGPAEAPQAAQAEHPDRVRVNRTISKTTVPGLAPGPARLIVTASRPVLFGLRRVTAEASRDLQVRLEQPRVSVLSTHHYVNQGGSELIVYRVEPGDVASGVRVGDVEYPGYPASGARGEGIAIADPAVRVAFFALLHDQDPNVPMKVFARDEAGNHAEADFDHRTFPKPAKQSKIPLDDKFLDRVVPAILAGSQEVKPSGTSIEKYLVINGELRRKNAEKIASFASETSPEMLWGGVVFHPFTNTAVESAFADRRTYTYQGQEVDHQVHLGFDLASVANASIVAANRGKVVYAADLGIYGNCVIIDHGMGVQSLYAHLSSIAVQPGAMVEKDKEIGRSGTTGLAGGDHLHFTMLVNGRMVNPIEWWDSHWIQDRVLRKLREVH